MKIQKRHSRKQIIEAIKYWQNVLKQMDESKSPLLDAFTEEFGADVVFSRKPFDSNIENFYLMFNIFNSYLFNNELDHSIEIKYLPYNSICKSTKAIYDKYKKPNDDEYVPPPETIYGMHFAIVLNDTFTYDEPLIFAKEEIIFLNESKIKGTSFSLHLASLCHEMIHYYDRLFGEYKDQYKAFFISKKNPKLHNTPTFERKMKEANNNYIDVVKNIPKLQTSSQSDDKAIDLILQALKESENGASCIIDENTSNVQFVGNKRYIVIQDFD